MSSESIKSTSEKGGNGGKKNGAIVIVVSISLIVILALVVVIILLTKNKNAESMVAEAATEANESSEQPRRDVITAENAEEIIEEFTKSSPEFIPQSYTVTQNSDWTFPDGNSPSTDAYVMNDVSNDTPVYFNVIVDETGETVYSSPVITLGAELTGFKLDTPLEAGTYICTVEYHLVDDDQNTLTTVNVGATLHILE
jgi:cytoskeletal protein RodZ